MFRKMPIILLVILVAVALFGAWVPLTTKAILLAVSLSIKSTIVFVLPLIVFGLLFKAAVHLSQQATKIILVILAGVVCSSFLSLSVSHFVGSMTYGLNVSLAAPHLGKVLTPAWDLYLPRFLANDVAMFSGLLLGVILFAVKPHLAKRVSSVFDIVVGRLLQLITWLIPFFVLGFAIKMQHEGTIATLVHDYASVFAIVAASLAAYLCLAYAALNGFDWRKTVHSFRNMLPAAIAGFSTMSSAAAMPLTIIGAGKNSHDPELAGAVVPATVNIHLIGDCFATPIFAYAVMKNFGHLEPMFLPYAIFACYFVLAKFSVAGVPGGGILVMLPVLESQLGFNADMLSLITALYILFDPVITCANVLGNGAFAMALEKVKRAMGSNA